MRRPDIGSLGSRVKAAKRSFGAGEAPQAVNDTWADRRGIDTYRGTFDVIGNFPGYSTNASLIVNATLAVTERFLVVDEWAPHGFALGLDSLVDISIDADPETFEDILVRFRSDPGISLFRLRVSRTRIPVRGKSKVIDLTSSLAAAGIPIAEFARTIGDAYSASWESLQMTDSDAVVWKGRLTAPLRPGRECAPTDVWVTPTALIWGSTKGRGINRVPLMAIERLGTVTLNDASRSPAVYIKTSPISDTRLDLPFIFNQSATATPIEARDGFLAIFRGDSVDEMSPPSDHQPWTSLSETGEPLGTDKVEPLGDDENIGANVGPPTDAEEPEVVEQEPVFETWADVRRPTVFPFSDSGDGGKGRRIDTPLYDESGFAYDSSGTRLVDALTSWPGGNQLYDAPPPEPEPIAEPKELLTYLARARRTIEEVNQAVDRRVAGQASPLLRSVPPSSEEQSRALAELIELAGTDYYSVEQTRTVKGQITRLGEAAIRLRSLLELCNAGHMTITEVAAKRDVIMSGLPLDEGVE